MVVEGVGDHGLEYMTGGLAVILGETGRNFAAGMSGGVAYVLDKNKQLEKNTNPEMVDLVTLTDEDEQILREFVEQHFQLTTSNVAFELLQNWDLAVRQFVKVLPRDFKAALDSRGITLAEQIKNKNVVYRDIVIEVSHS